MAFDHELVDVRRLGRVECGEGEVVEDEQVDPQQAAQLGVVGGVQAGCPEALEEPVGPSDEDAPPAPAGDVPEGRGEVGLADPTGPMTMTSAASSQKRRLVSSAHRARSKLTAALSSQRSSVIEGSSPATAARRAADVRSRLATSSARTSSRNSAWGRPAVVVHQRTAPTRASARPANASPQKNDSRT